MKIKIDWEKTIFQKDEVRQIKEIDIDNFAIKVTEENNIFDLNNLFFMLINSAHYYNENKKEYETAAYLFYLTAYFVSGWLHPIGEENISLYCINNAIKLSNDTEKYIEFKCKITKK